MFGSDFPFVQQQQGAADRSGQGGQGKDAPYVSYVEAPSLWPESGRALTERQWASIMGGTADRLYGTNG